jgi:hypothetical protein
MAVEHLFQPNDGKALPCHAGLRRTEYVERGSDLPVSSEPAHVAAPCSRYACGVRSTGPSSGGGWSSTC